MRRFFRCDDGIEGILRIDSDVISMLIKTQSVYLQNHYEKTMGHRLDKDLYLNESSNLSCTSLGDSSRRSACFEIDIPAEAAVRRRCAVQSEEARKTHPSVASNI